MLKMSNFILLFMLSLIFVSCGTSISNRYDKKEKDALISVSKTSETEKLTEDFDITPYRTKLDIKNNTGIYSDTDLNIWYNYNELPDTNTNTKTVLTTVNGYRVQVISTDNLDEANSVRSEIYFKTNRKDIYVDFDPPFYKVKIGDFRDKNEAKALSFKLNQMGYSEAHVINESVNVYQR